VSDTVCVPMKRGLADLVATDEFLRKASVTSHGNRDNGTIVLSDFMRLPDTREWSLSIEIRHPDGRRLMSLLDRDQAIRMRNHLNDMIVTSFDANKYADTPCPTPNLVHRWIRRVTRRQKSVSKSYPPGRF
jgi:hypothetical protein